MVALLARLARSTTSSVRVGIPDTNWESKAKVVERIESFMSKMIIDVTLKYSCLKVNGLVLKLYIILPSRNRRDRSSLTLLHAIINI
jgi:hypothetical protein